MPVFQNLTIYDYGLFPGKPPGSGIDVDFSAGLTLIIGANGLGKSTLIQILYRMLSGPADIRGLAHRVTLGNLPLEAIDMDRYDRRTFGQRVADGAENSIASLAVSFGRKRVRITRRLTDLALVELQVGSESLDVRSEENYRNAVSRLANVTSFGDWLFLLNVLVFYFENRRQLVWDQSAQAQILRIMFVSATESTKLVKLRDDIMSLDSHVRNARAVLGRAERDFQREQTKGERAVDVRAELATLESYDQADQELLKSIAEQLSSLENHRQQQRRELLTLQQRRDLAYRDLERAKLLALTRLLPNASENNRYILAQLLTDGRCLACGSTSPNSAAILARRLVDDRCIICDSELGTTETRIVALSPKQITKAENRLAEYDLAISATEARLKGIAEDMSRYEREEDELRRHVLERSAAIARLAADLPSDQVNARIRATAMLAQRVDLDNRQKELNQMRDGYRGLLEPITRQLQTHSDEIRSAFERFARDFLLEDITLNWAPYRAPLGETGHVFEWPAFALDMGSGALLVPSRRSTPDQVSESQREFIDLAFRMALMSVGAQGSATLVIDAPESSLDAVFVARAANVLARFAKASSNRLLVTSNLIDGQLIPSLVKESKHGDESPRLVDLFDLAVPTAATLALSTDYAKARTRLLKGSHR